MAVSYIAPPISKSIRSSLLYTPCHCPIGAQLHEQQVGSGRAARKPKRYRTSRRIRYLAKPRKPCRKFEPCLVQPYTMQTEVSRSYEEPHASRRLQQLASPPVRKLVAAQQEYRRLLSRSRQDQLDKRITKGIFTVYSRLANVELPELDQMKGMAPEQWQKHRDWLTRNAQPKARSAPEQPARERKPLTALIDRIESLSAARSPRGKFTGKEKPVPAVSPAALKATPSEHVQKLAKPIDRRRQVKGTIVEETGIPENVLKAKASSRVLELAAAKKYQNVKNHYHDHPFTVEPNALKAKASDRVLELAKSKKRKK